jgi:hypothetical protein
MKTITCVLAILAAVSTAAVAKDLKQNQKAAAPTVAATQMTDAEMDKVTAGVGYVNFYNPGEVYVTIFTNGQGPNPPDGKIVYPGYPHTSSRVCINACFP